MSNDEDDGSVTKEWSFRIGPGEVREIHDDAVEVFDTALAGVGDGDVNHFIDPQRLQKFGAGGPSVWSVATVGTPAGTLYLTYGFSDRLDPGRSPCDFEMTVLVPGPPTIWPALLLRALCRYMLGSGRALEVGQAMPFPDAITRFFAPPHERSSYPETQMNAAIFADDPVLPTIDTARGVVYVRRVVGLYPDEQPLMSLWSPAGFIEALRTRDPHLITDIARGRVTADAEFVTRIEQGSRQYGSEVAYIAVPGVSWENDEKELRVTFPGGEYAHAIRRMLRARLPFGRHLLVHDVDPGNPSAVAFEPGTALDIGRDGDVLIVTLPPDHGLLDTFDDVAGPSVQWTLSTR